MAISGNPKKLAQDIADGFHSLSLPVLKKYSPADLKIILTNMSIVKRDIRQILVPPDEVQLIKAKNMKVSRLNQAEMVLRSFCKKKRIPI